VRLGGEDRYDTSAEVAEWAVANGLGWGRPVVATGHDFADALSAAAVCGANRSVLLLADSADAPTISLLRQNRSRVVRAYVAGGTGAVSSAVESAVRSALT
jgi:putative cell wall-binding protein